MQLHEASGKAFGPFREALFRGARVCSCSHGPNARPPVITGVLTGEAVPLCFAGRDDATGAPASFQTADAGQRNEECGRVVAQVVVLMIDHRAKQRAQDLGRQRVRGDLFHK